MNTRILFVGNSFVTRNDLPGLVAGLAQSAGHTVEFAVIAAGGASLRRHFNAGTVASALTSSRWDVVVLQEQSTLPVKNPSRYHENVRALHGLIDAAGAETVLYLTWARRAAPATQQQLTQAVRAIGAEIGARVAPVGVAWEAILDRHPEVELHAVDGSHPTATGSLLAAYVLYGTLFPDREIPAAVPGSLKLSAATGGLLVDAARDVTGSQRSTARGRPPGNS